jgi:hypothetical protein
MLSVVTRRVVGAAIRPRIRMRLRRLMSWETGEALVVFTMHDLIRNLQRSVGDVRAEWDLPRLGDPLAQGCSLPRLHGVFDHNHAKTKKLVEAANLWRLS